MLLRRNGSAEFFSPLGRKIHEAPAPPRLPVRPVEALRLENVQCGLEIDAETATPTWGSDRFDLHWAVDGYRSIGCARALPS